MRAVADVIEAVIVPLLQIGGTILAGLLVWLVAEHGVNAAAERLRRRTAAIYRTWLDRQDHDPEIRVAMTRSVRGARGRRILGEELLADAANASPERRQWLRQVADSLGLLEMWRQALDDRRWWVRASGARALGLLGDGVFLDRSSALLDDADPDVRAATIDALGRSGDPGAIGVLLQHLVDPSRGHRLRIVGALRMLGAGAMPEVVEWVAQHAEDAEVLAGLFAGSAGESLERALVARCSGADSASREAVLRVLSRITRPSFHSVQCALAGLQDPAPDVRALSARLLGRTGSAAAAAPLDARLDDEWAVAAESAVALRRLGTPGLVRLQMRALEAGQAGDLARQMVSEARHGLPPAEGVA